MPEFPAPLVPVVRHSMHALGALPRGVQRRLAGPPVEVDGQRMAPEIQLTLRLEERFDEQTFEEFPVPEARRMLEADALLVAPPPAPLREVRDLEVGGGEGPLPARLYVPTDAADPGGLVVAFHGGGWVQGSLRSHEPAFRVLARESGVRVLSVEYRLAPEHPFPAGPDDALAAFRWVVENAAELGADPARVGVGGDSAGGNLAAVVARLAASDRVPPAIQALVYPVCDRSAKSRSYELFRDGFFLTEGQMDWYADHYLSDPAEASDPRVSPLLADHLEGLPPAYVAVAGFDPLRDEGIAYAERLRAAGVEVELRVHRALIHGFFNMTWVSRAAAAAVDDLAGALRARLGG